MSAHELITRLKAAVEGLTRLGLLSESLRLLDWFKHRPCLRGATSQNAAIELDPMTELVLLHVEHLAAIATAVETPPRRVDEVRREVHLIAGALMREANTR